ncbi:hypothetical protein ACFY2Y_05175 [Janibacter hoylei]|uniref:hypothetical protein n=1 Tax=Janibacter hoylei TaxID=364298 RepID=UPI003684760F
MSWYEGACEVCVDACTSGARHTSVRQVATADGVQIRHCSRCDAWWDMQPATRPAVISREEAARRAPDADRWTIVDPLLEPRDPVGLLVDAQRVDAHPGDLLDLHRPAELAGDATLQDVLTTVTAGSPGTHSARLLVPNELARTFAGGHRLDVACRPR